MAESFALVAFSIVRGVLAVYVLDTGLTADDCRSELAHGVSAVVAFHNRQTLKAPLDPVTTETACVLDGSERF